MTKPTSTASLGKTISRHPKPGELVAIPVARDQFGMLVVLPKSDDGDTCGLFQGLHSLEAVTRESWSPTAFPTPFVTAFTMFRELGWRCVGYRPDLISKFDAHSWLRHPGEATDGEYLGKYGLEIMPGGERRELSREEAQRRFLLLRGDYFRFVQPENVVDLYREHYLGEETHQPEWEREGVALLTHVKRGSKARSLGTLKRKRFFASWKGFVPASVIRSAEAEVRQAIESLQGKSPAQAAQRLAALVRTFNTLNGKDGLDIGTLERETIMDAIRAVASASGVDEQAFDEIVEASWTQRFL